MLNEGLGEIYHKTPEQAKEFIETMGHCLMGFDPNSDLRISISVIQMKVDIPNTKSQSDDEILSRMEAETRNIFEDTTKVERWIIKTNDCVFICNLYSIMGVKQLDCSTVVDGYTYQFLIRGTNVEQMKLVANDIAHSTIISVPLGGIRNIVAGERTRVKQVLFMRHPGFHEPVCHGLPYAP